MPDHQHPHPFSEPRDDGADDYEQAEAGQDAPDRGAPDSSGDH